MQTAAQRRKKKKKKLKKARRPSGWFVDKRSQKRAKKNGKIRHPSELFYISEPSLFDDEEGTFINYNTRRRVKVHLVPAPWSRVLMLSLIYAFMISLVKFGYFHFFGKPQWSTAAEVSETIEQVQPSTTFASKPDA